MGLVNRDKKSPAHRACVAGGYLEARQPSHGLVNPGKKDGKGGFGYC